jgi:hypothetical protein
VSYVVKQGGLEREQSLRLVRTDLAGRQNWHHQHIALRNGKISLGKIDIEKSFFCQLFGVNAAPYVEGGNRSD